MIKSLLVFTLVTTAVADNSSGQTPAAAPEAYPAVKHGTLYMYS
jgi:hypothetical protein